MGSDNTSENNKLDLDKQDYSEGLGTPIKQPHRQRLNSDPQQIPDSEKLQPIRRYSKTNSIQLDSLHHSINAFPVKQKESSLNPKFEKGYKRKLSQQYCTDFKNNYKGNSIFLSHLADSLCHGQTQDEPDFEKIRKQYVPEYMFDWRYVDDPKIGVKSWKNYGKIKIDSNMFQKIRNLGSTSIGASEPFYLKRSWLFSYIIHRFGKRGHENPTITVDKNNIFEDSYNKFIKTKDLIISRPLKIKFVNEKEEDEEGIYREWYSCMFKEMISPKLRLFMYNPYPCCEQNTLLFYPKYPGMKFEYYVFIGKLIVKAIVDLIPIRSMKLNRVLLKAISNRPINLDDIKYYNLDLYQKLKYINDNQILGNPQFQQIRFIWNIKNQQNLIQEIEIVPGGKNIFLNDNNKFSFIDKVIYTEVVKPYEDHIKSIQKGLHSIFKGELEGKFSVEELNFLISGQDIIDINDWKENTNYKGSYNANHPVIKMFWQKIGSLNKKEIIQFLRFSTGSSSVPIDGFGSLKGVGGKIQKFTIEPYTNYSAENPDVYKFHKIEAKRCHHTIILPMYQSKEELDKAINIILNDVK
jgi:hypothetical protein